MATLIQADRGVGGRVRADSNRYECAGGIVVPKVNIGAIRGGVPWKITKTVQQCAIYVDVRITPVQEPLDVREELRRAHGRRRARRARWSSTSSVPAFEADEKKAAPLRTRSRAPTGRCRGTRRSRHRRRSPTCGATSTASTRCASRRSPTGRA